MSGIYLTTNFVPNTNNPLDSRIVVADLTARNSLTFTYPGMIAYVSANDSLYFLSGGTTSSYWKPLSAIVGHISGGSGGGVWGSISGNISAQLDLMSQFGSTLASAHSYDVSLSSSLYEMYHADDKNVSGQLHSQVTSVSAADAIGWHASDVSLSGQLYSLYHGDDKSTSASLYSTLHDQITSTSAVGAAAYHYADKILSGELYTLYHADDKSISGTLHSQITAVSASNLNTWHQADLNVSSYVYSELHSQITAVTGASSSGWHPADIVLSGQLYDLYHADDKTVSGSVYSTLHGQITATSASNALAWHSADKLISGELVPLYHAGDVAVSGAMHSQIVSTSASNLGSWHSSDLSMSGSLYSTLHGQVISTSAENQVSWHAGDTAISAFLHGQIVAASGADQDLWHDADKNLSAGLYTLYHADDKNISGFLHSQVTSVSGSNFSSWHGADLNISATITSNYHSDDKIVSGDLHSQITSTSGANYTSWHASDIAVSANSHALDMTLSGQIYTLYHADDKAISAALHIQTLAASAVTVDTSTFTKNLSSTDTTVQHALNTIDQLTTGGTSSAITESIYQVSHGFTANQPISILLNGVFVLSKADTAANAEFFGIVKTVTDADHVVVTKAGLHTWTHGFDLADGPTLFVSDATAGVLTLTPPSTLASYVLPCANLKDANTIEVFKAQAVQITAAAGNVVGPVASVAGHRVLWNNTSGTEVKDSGIPDFVPLDICDIRLSLASGTPITASDITAATTLYACLYHGNRIALYDATVDWYVVSISELSFALTGLTSSTNFDVFIRNEGTVDSPSIALYLLAWASASTRATALVLQNGVKTLTGHPEYRYVGTIRTTSTTGQCEDSTTRRFVWNEYNQVDRAITTYNSNASWTYTTGAWRESNAGTGQIRGETVVGDVMFARSLNRLYATGAGYRQLSIDAPANTNAGCEWTSSYLVVCYEVTTMLSVGYHYVTISEYAIGSITCYGAYGYSLLFKG